MKRLRKILTGTLLILIILLFCSPSGFAAEDKEVIKWKGQGFVPAGMLFHEAFVRIADEIEKVTNGRLVIDVNPPGTFVPPLKGLKAVSDNVYQVNFGYSAMWIGDMQAAPLFTSVPGGFNPKGMKMWIEEGGGKKLWQEMYDRKGYNVKLLPAGILPMENFMWSKEPVRTIEDMKGLKMRMMPLMGEVLQANGLSVHFIPAGEIMPNLQRGVIDAAEYSIPSFDRTMGLWEVCNNVVVPGVHQPSSNLELLINKDAWNELPDELKSQVKAAIGKMRYENELWMRKKDMEAVEFFKEKGINFTRLEPEAIETLIEWSSDYLDSLAEDDEFFAKVWKSQKEFSEIWYQHDKYYNLPH